MSQTVSRKVASKRLGESNNNERDLYSTGGESYPKRSKQQNVKEYLAEVTFDITIKYNTKKEKTKETLIELIKYIVALLNSVGGVIRIDECGNDEAIIISQRDKWMLTLQHKLVEIMGANQYKECIHFFMKKPYYYVFVRKSKRVCTQNSGLKVSLPRSVMNATYDDTVKILNCNNNSTPNSKSSSLEEGVEDMECDYDSGYPAEFHYDRKVVFEESDTVQFKLIEEGEASLQELLEGIDKHLPNYVSAFANSSGGDVYFGIRDDGEVKGQLVKGDDEKTEVKKIVEKIINRKDANQERIRIWGNPDFIPKYGEQWSVEFVEVIGEPKGEERYVVVVQIFPFNGGMFLEHPLAWKVNETSELIIKMDFKEWRNRHISDSDDRQEMLKKFECLTLDGIGKRVYQLKDLTRKFAKDVFPADKGLVFIPENFAERFKLEPYKNCIQQLEKMLSRKFSNTKGFVMFDKSWSGNIDTGPVPEEVICDMFVMSHTDMPQMITLATEYSEKVIQYNVDLAKKLKAALVSKGGCLERFVVITQIILVNDAKDDIKFSPPDVDPNRYPPAYNMTPQSFSRIREALVIVLAGFETSAFNPAVGASFLYVLTPEQYNISIKEDHFVLVSAPPGTGKTVVAMERIKRLKARNVSKAEILYICENKALKSFIWSELGDICIPITRKMFMSKINRNEFSEFDHVRHVVVDEAQHFRNDKGEDWLKTIWTMLKWPDSSQQQYENTSLYIFSDQLQKIRLDSAGISTDMLSELLPTKCQLSTVIRNSVKIYKKWEEIALRQPDLKQKNHLAIAHDYQGPDVEVVKISWNAEREIFGKVREKIFQILNEKSYKCSDVAILFNTQDIAEQFRKELLANSDITSVSDAEEFPREGLVVDSFRRFSGLDAPVVIAVIPKTYSKYENGDKVKILLYSRAMVEFHIILHAHQKEG